MSKVAGIQFRKQGKIYDYDCGHFVLKKGDKVIIVSDDGPVVGCVTTEPYNRPDTENSPPLNKVFRLATEKEIENFNNNCSREQEVKKFCSRRIEERAIQMRLINVERRFDGGKIIIYFTADGRVDFRELVKDLVKKFRTRIEMKQIGVRHEAKMLGGLGTCGRPLCCRTHLNTFAPVTIKMAKEQNISLNPGKISGMCGRLMCCLTYEHPYYEKVKKNMPKIGKMVMTQKGEGKVIRQNVLHEKVVVALTSGEEIEIGVTELTRDRRFRKGPKHGKKRRK